jgi:thiol-disulfide isomerase/thioredoxin
MSAIATGSAAPEVPGAPTGARVVAFYKVDCPVCQMAAPKIDLLERAYPGRIIAVGQDAERDLAVFAAAYGLTSVPSTPDVAPYRVSDAYGIEVVPTLFLVGEDGSVTDVVESWDRDGYDRISQALADLTGAEFRSVSEEDDGLPAFRPG